MFYSQTFLKSIAWEIASQVALKNCSKEAREEPIYIEAFFFFEIKNKVVEHQKITANHTHTQKKIQTSLVSDFHASLCVERCRTLSSLKVLFR